MFLLEQTLKQKFWEYYNYNGRAYNFRFEMEIEGRPVDLVTIERWRGQYQLNAFEFKLEDIKKAILQARANVPYVHKSWIVLPAEKEKVIENKYRLNKNDLNEVGVIVVEETGNWRVVKQAKFNPNIIVNQAMLTFICKNQERR